MDTGNGDRDNHLKSPDFFDVEEFPIMSFTSTGVEMVSDTEGKLLGNLTLHGVTKAVKNK